MCRSSEYRVTQQLNWLILACREEQCIGFSMHAILLGGNRVRCRAAFNVVGAKLRMLQIADAGPLCRDYM